MNWLQLMEGVKDEERREAAAELGRFLRGAPAGQDQGGTELYEDRLEREERQARAEENEKAEMQEDMPALQAGDRAAAKSMQMQGPPPDGDQLAQQAFSEAEDNRQLEVARSTFDVPVFKGELRRRLEARGREGRILKKMSEGGGKAVKRKKR